MAPFAGPVVFRVQTLKKRVIKKKSIAGPYSGVFFTNSFAAQVTGVTVLLNVVGMRA